MPMRRLPCAIYVDLLILSAFILYSIVSGLRARSKASESLDEYFLAGRTLFFSPLRGSSRLRRHLGDGGQNDTGKEESQTHGG